MFGFAAALLVLDLAVHPPGTPLQQAQHAWTGYLAYVVSFLTIGGCVAPAHRPVRPLARADQLFLRLNLLLLLVVVFLLPFRPGSPEKPCTTAAANGCMSPSTGSRSWPSACWTDAREASSAGGRALIEC